jgi:hypothetical protein
MKILSKSDIKQIAYFNDLGYTQLRDNFIKIKFNHNVYTDR